MWSALLLELDRLDVQQGIAQYRYDPVAFSENVLGVWLHPDQRRILREAFVFAPDMTLVFKYIHLSAGNRYGKSTLLAVIHLWWAAYKHQLWLPGKHPMNPTWSFMEWWDYPISIVNMAPLAELAGVIRDKIHGILLGTSEEQLKNPRGRGHLLEGFIELFVPDDRGQVLRTVSRDSDYQGFITVHNVTMEYRTTDDNARAAQGRNRFLITIDEAGRQKKTFTGLMGPHIQPRVMDTPGCVIDVTTPDKDTNNDYEDWHIFGLERIEQDGVWIENASRDPSHISFFGATVEYDETLKIETFAELRKHGTIVNPFITWKMIEEALAGSAPYIWPQILRGRFVQSEEAFFNAKSIALSRTPGRPNARRMAGHRYAIGCDLAVAKAGDFSVFVVWDITQVPYDVIYYKRLPRGTPHPDLIDKMKVLLAYYNAEWFEEDLKVKSKADLVYDATGMGGRMFQYDLDTVRPRPRPFDYAGTTAKKLAILKSLAIFYDKELLQVPAEFRGIFQGMRAYKRTDDKLQTDEVMAMALAGWWAERYRPVTTVTAKKKTYDFSIY